MELSDSEQLSYLVANLTTNGKNGFDKPNLKKLKSMCRKSDFALEEAFRMIYSQLEKDHSEIRLAAVLLIDEFFQRSHLFRTLLLEKFDEFFELAAGTNFDMPLPEPKSIAQDLMKTTVKCVHNWHGKFGAAYKRLSLGYNFLRGTKKIRLINADEVQTEIQRNASEYLRRKKEEQKKQKLDKLVLEIKLDEADVKVCVAELDACIRLLVPKLTDDEEAKNIPFTAESEKSRASGITSHDYNIVLDIPQHVVKFVDIQRSKDNAVILENLRDRETVLRNCYLPKVKTWIQQLSNYEAENDAVKELIDVKMAILNCLSKAEDLIVRKEGDDVPSTSRLQRNADQVLSDCESSDDDFVEVPEKVVAPVLADTASTRTSQQANLTTDLSIENGKVNHWKLIRDDDNLDDPASYSRALAVQRKVLKSTETSKCDPVKIHPKKQKTGHFVTSNSLNADAPIVPFGQDLLEWDDLKKNELKETLSLGMARELDIGHRFWSGDTASKGEKVSEAAISALTSRSIAFVGTFEPVNHTCRAPLPSGKLCPRMDRVKCPFHGVIIPRDPNGQPIDPDHRKEGRKRLVNESKYPDWQDPELLRELRSVTGVDLKMPPERSRKKAKMRKSTGNNLTDVKNLKNTSRYRLQKKVLNTKSIKRVSETLDTLDAKRNFQKFGNNFNYALN